MASAFALSLLAYPALAQAPSNAPEATAPAAPPSRTRKQGHDEVLANGNDAIREIAAAPVAIFDGDPKLASDMITKAKASVAKAELEHRCLPSRRPGRAQGNELGTTSNDKS